jgi:hypothetical protein
MRCAVVFAVGALTLVMATPAGAQQFKPPVDLFVEKKAAPKPPVVDWSWRPSTDQRSISTPTVICGMTLVPADPKVDPKMRVARPARGVDFTMRVVPPTVCKPR